MSSGSLRDLAKTLGTTLSAPPVYPLPEDVIGVIQNYLDKQDEHDEHETVRLHEELLALHASKVAGHPGRLAVFLACFRNLQPAITKVEHLAKWWDILVKPTMDSMEQAKAVIADARGIVLNVLAYDEDDDPTGEKAEAAAVFSSRLFEIFLERTSKSGADRMGGYSQEQKQRFVSQNVEAVLLSYGKRRPKDFLNTIDTFIVHKDTRLQVLGLLCSYVRLQGPHLYHVIDTPLFDHLLQCLENDTSTTVISLALTILIMFMPHLCNSLAAFLPRLFVVYTRVLCWDKFGVVRLDVASPSTYSRTNSPLSPDKPEEPTSSPVWQKLDSSFETAMSTTPDVSDYFTFLYGLYPINFLSFIRAPYRFLENVNYKGIDQLEMEEDTIKQRTEAYRQRHILHPNFLTLTAETELKDQHRWMKVEPADVTAQCIGLVNNPISTISDRQRPLQVIPDELLPTEDIPPESLLSQEEEASGSEISGQVTRLPNIRSQYLSTTPPSRQDKSPDSPTIPMTLAPGDESRLQDMLNLQEQLHASMHETLKHNATPPPQTSLPQPPGPPPYPGSVATSPRLDSYVHSLSLTTMPRSPALRPAPTDTQGTISYLQREVMLLKNDLNFERYLKQQHLSHIGHLQRKHIKESTAEAETQNLINTNKSLKAKVEEAKKAYVALKQESLKTKTTAKKWEAELSAKIRTLREEQKAWRADEEATKQGLASAKQEADHLRKLLSETEAEGLRNRQQLQDLSSEMEEVNKLRKFVDHLSNKLTEYEARSEEFEMQRHNEDAALAQSERLKMRMQSREHEVTQMRRNYESKLQELESRVGSMSNAPPTSPGSGFQSIIDSALAQSNSRLESLKKAHGHLLRKYTDLEIRFMELQAAHEMGNVGMHTPTSTNQYPGSSAYDHSDAEHAHASMSHQGRSMSHTGHRNYPHSEDSMSPVSSYTESSAGQSHYSSGTGMHSYHMGQSPPQSVANFNMGRNNNFVQDSIREVDFPMPGQRQQLRNRPSMVDSSAHSVRSASSTGHASSSAANTGMSASDDAQSMKTVTSATSSEKRRAETVKPAPEIRARGRGGVQNISKKDKKEKYVENENGEMVPKPKKKSRFTTGSGLAGIRGFV